MPTSDLIRRIPWPIAICACALLVIGLTGIARADELSAGPDLFSKQLTWAFVSIPALAMAFAIPYRTWKPMGHVLFLMSLPLLIVVLFMEKRGGARCWIQLGFFDLQPSEFVKLTYIMVLAQYLMYRDNFLKVAGLIAPFALTLVPLALILLEPDLGTALLFVPVLFAMLFTAGARWRNLVCVGLLGLAISPLFWMKMNTEQKSRIRALLLQVDGGPNPGGDRRHQHQSKVVLSLGGLEGSALAGARIDDPRAYLLSNSQTDFVFCLIGERWGFIGATFTLLLYLLFFALGLKIAARTQEPFGRLIVVGIVTLWATQTIINTGMTVGLLPVIGITLPLMSYGGSSLVMAAISLGILMNVGARPGYEVAGEPFRFD